MELTIRRATMEDVGELERLIAASVRALSVGYYTHEEAERALRVVFGVDTQLIADGTYYVVESEGRIVGCGGWSRRKTLFGGDQMKGDAPDPSLDPATDAARIRAFFVHPDAARRGVGSRILRECEERAHEAGFRRAELVATLPGEPLYAALGYARTGELSVDLGDGYTLKTYPMEKPLRTGRV
jgi:GNAT superfamily N-acetyltransferase